MSKPILIIDPGHGGKDIGGGSNSLFREKDLTLMISSYQYHRLKELGVLVTMTRMEDIYLSPSNRTKIIRESGAKYCISNHINAATPQARGVETIHSIYSDGKLAKALYQAIVDEGMVKRRVFSKESKSVKGKDYYYLHRKTGSIITTIIEYGFATNTEDTKLLNVRWKDYAEATVKAFCHFIGQNYQLPIDKKQKKEESRVLPIIKETVKVKLEDETLSAYLTNEGKTVIELREIAEKLNLLVEWISSTKTVVLKKKK